MHSNQPVDEGSAGNQSTQDEQPSRRRFLKSSAAGLLAATIATDALAQAGTPALPPGAPPAFGTAPAFGPEVSVETFAQAEKLVEVELTAKDRAEAAGNWRQAMAPFYERRVGPRVVPLPDSVSPATVWHPLLPGEQLVASAQGRPLPTISARSTTTAFVR